MTIQGSCKWLLVWVAVAGMLPAVRADVDSITVKQIAPVHLDSPYRPGRVIVKYREEASKSAAMKSEVRARVAGSVSSTYRTMPQLETIAIDPASSVEAAVAALAADPRVEYAEPDFYWTIDAVPDDLHFDKEWGLNNTGQPIGQYEGEAPGIDIDAPEAWEHGTGSRDIVVADIDEGCDYTHPDLAPNMWTNAGEIPDNEIDDDGNGFVDDVHGWDFLHNDATTYDGAFDHTNGTDFHGTHTSGTIGAVGNNGIGVTGVCWAVSIMSLKFLEGTGSTENAIGCVDYIVAMKERGVNIRAINASWGGGAFSQGLYDAIGRAGQLGILFCASSGNGGGDSRADNNDVAPAYPASYDLPNIISVGAWTRYDQAALFSNYGATTVDLMAPGGLVASTGPNGGYYYLSGTSMAAPHVTGTVALIASIAPSLTGEQIKAIIMSTTTPVPLAPATVTGGRLNLKAAVEAAIAQDPGGGDPGGGDPGGGPDDPPPAPAPVIFYVKFKKSTLYVDGRQLTSHSVIEVDGTALPVMRFSDRDLLDDGTYLRISGKAPGQINSLVPKNREVLLTVFDSETGQRSAPFPFKRKK